MEVVRYIHRNPLKARIVKTVDDFSWSSHQSYLSGAKKWSWPHKDVILNQLSQVRSKQKSAYLDFLSFSDTQEIEKFYAQKNMPSILGSTSFKEYIKEKFHQLTKTPEISGAKALAPDPGKVLSQVCEYFQVPRQELLISKRGTENIPRDIAIYLVRRLCHLTLPLVGKEFGISNYSTVSSVVQRVKLRLEKDSKLNRDVSDISKKVLISQKRT